MCGSYMGFYGSACRGDNQTTWPGALEDNTVCLQQEKT